MHCRLVVSAVALSCLLLACDKKEPPAEAPTTTVAPAMTSATAMPAASPGASAVAMAGTVRLEVRKGRASFLIDAPSEKIKGATDDSKGRLDIVPQDLTKTRGEIDFRLTTLKTATFEDKDKNDAQSTHARDWMEVGPDSAADKKATYEWTTFTITSVETATPKLADVKEEGDGRAVKARVTGNYVLHGVTAQKTIPVTARFKGPADAPTEVSIQSDEPFPVSMKEHQVMPRDKLGSFLNGALEKIGKKIDDKVQVSISATAGR